MANERNGQSRFTIVPNHHLVDFQAVNHHHHHPFTFISRPQINVSNPSCGPPFPFPPIPVNPAILALMEQRSYSLLQFMDDVGLMPCPEEEIKRETVVDELKKILMKWIKRVARNHQPRREYARAGSATLLTYGSYGLGVHTSESDIDAICIAPCFATMAEDFFVLLHNMLARRPEVSDIRCVKDAKVPLMRFKFYGISVDLPYAQLRVSSIPENVDIFNPFFLRDIDESSRKSLSGVRVNRTILQLVPDVVVFREMLRCIKFWAKRRGVYGNLFGFFGGVHWAILVVYVCLRRPNARLASLIGVFFTIFGNWDWPTPVILLNGIKPSITYNGTRFFMPIQLPCSPHKLCHSNITSSTFHKIRAEFITGHSLTKDLLRPADFDWSSLFEPFPYSRRFQMFVKICLSASDHEGLGDWVGWLKFRFRCLLLKLEEEQGMVDPNPSEYFDASLGKPNVIFYWGLQANRADSVDIHSVEEEFKKSISNGYKGCPGGMMGLSIVPSSQLPRNPQCNGTRNVSGISNRNRQKMPLYSKQRPQSFAGSMATNGNPEYPSARN